MRPPAPSQAARNAAGAAGALTGADLARLAAARRATAGTPEPVGTGGIADVFEEARLIEWPSPARALADTALVVAIVAGSAALLFVVNSGLTDLAKAIYD
jgi:preprotein translocase SecE subunit